VLVLIQIWNWYLRHSEGAVAVLPTGLILSLVAVLLMLAGWAGRWSIEITLRCLTKRAARPYRLTDPEHELIGPGIEPIAECSRFSRCNGIGARARSTRLSPHPHYL
jgi:hypothetical protein